MQHILVPLDGSELAEQAIVHAAALARLFGAGITLARVPEPMIMPTMSAGVWVAQQVDTPEAHELATEYLNALAGRPDLADLKVDVATPHYPVVTGLIEAVTTTGTDLVVMTTHGYSGVVRALLGSVADKLVRHAPAQLLVIRPADEAPRPPAYRRIVVPLDGSTSAEQALVPAEALAVASGGELDLVQVPTVPAYAKAVPETAGWIPGLLHEMAAEGEAYLLEAAKAEDRKEVKVNTHVQLVMAGSVAEGILEYVRERDADLVVMSTHGRSGLSRWFLGSVTDEVLHLCDRPVWIVRMNAEDC